ncbi:MAG: hypothetical protein JXM79_03115 [Sedimentisphaerales bacterium]|nr:hypothetical protein [Sedimentisphaerales bacterium]
MDPVTEEHPHTFVARGLDFVHLGRIALSVSTDRHALRRSPKDDMKKTCLGFSLGIPVMAEII